MKIHSEEQAYNYYTSAEYWNSLPYQHPCPFCGTIPDIKGFCKCEDLKDQKPLDSTTKPVLLVELK